MRLNNWLLLALTLFVIQGCVIAPVAPPQHQGPPDHAPAHGYRNKYRYHYYPDVGVYFDLDRKIYFYLDRGWRSAVVLPRHLRVLLGGPVTLNLDLAEPYYRYDEHRSKYPPKGRKNKTKKKW
ncbi:MAG: hypothetical protein CVU60_05855 [Deltaproteobacteria bacterium HGW-Deltaproteobacteria-18]|jgi:hypothetical protein|nr:MAG: hypothetical protein CVU60_05855 [Deltaproteobacteria bacterium HGW-Deltaproteobacteria-18]